MRIKINIGITILLGIVMLFSCKNSMQEVVAITSDEARPDMDGSQMKITYSDSGLIRYKMLAPHYLKYSEGDVKYEEFPKGIYIESYDRNGNVIGSIAAKYAKKLEKNQLWEARDSVVVLNYEGKKLETELLFWDIKTETIYTDRYAKLTSGTQILEGNNGLKSDQNLNDPVFYGITGVVEVDNKYEN